MAGAVDLFSGSNSISGSNLFYVDKNPLDQLTSTLSDIGQRDLLGDFTTFVASIIDGVVEFFENLTGLNINEGPILFFASVWDRLNNITGLVWDQGPIDFLVSIVDAVVNAIETLTGLNVNEGPIKFFESLWTNLENATGLNWNEGPIAFLVSVVDAIVAAIENLTSLNINEGPVKFFESLWAALETATGLNWDQGPIEFLISVVTAVVSTLETLTGLNIDQGPGPFLDSLVARIEQLTSWDLTHGPEAFLQSVVTATIAAVENATGLNIDAGPEAFFSSLLSNLESVTGLDWSHGPGPFLQSVVDAVVGAIEYLTGLNINEGPEPFLQSLFGELIAGPQQILGNFIQALDATGQGLAERIGRAIIAVIRGIPFVGDAIADTLTSVLDGLVWFIRGGNQSGSNLLADPGAENAAYWSATYQQGDLTVASTLWGTKKQPEVTRDTTVKRSAGASLRLTSGGSNPQSFYWNVNDLGTVVPISTTTGDWFYAECYVVAPNTNVGSAAVTIVAEFTNSVDPNAKTTSTVTEGISKGDWNKVAGTFTVPSGYDRISFGFLLGANNTTSGDKFYVDDMLVREVTGTQNTLQGIHQAIRGGDGTTLISLSAVGTALGGLTDLTRGKGEAGSNLLVDPKASYPSLWIATGLAISKAVGTYKSASSSLAFTSAGSTARSFDWTLNDTGATTPIVAQPDDVFYCECYVLSPPGNGAATITLHGKARNSATGATLTLTPQLTGSPVASGPWIKISGQYKMPSSGGYDGFIAGITLGSGDTTNGNKFYIDDMVVREVTGTQNTIDAVSQAVYGDGIGTGNTVLTIKDAVSGLQNIAQGTAQSGTNLLVDPKINYANFWTGIATGLAVSNTYYNSTSQSLELTSAGATARSFLWTINNARAVVPIITQPDKIFYVECMALAASGNATTTATITLYAQGHKFSNGLRSSNIAPMTFLGAGTWSNTTLTNPALQSTAVNGAWTNKLYGYFTVPAGYDGFVCGVSVTSGAAGTKYYFDDLVVYEVTEAVNTNNKLYSTPTPTNRITTDALPTNIPSGNVSGLDNLNTTVTGAGGLTTTVNGIGGLKDLVNGNATYGYPGLHPTVMYAGGLNDQIYGNATYGVTGLKPTVLNAGGLKDVVVGGNGITGLNTTVNAAGTGLKDVVTGGNGVTGLTTTVPGTINAIGQGIFKTNNTYAYTNIKDAMQRFVSAIGVGLSGQPASRLDAMANGAGFLSITEMLAQGNATSNSIASVASAVAELQKKSSQASSGGASVYTAFSSTGLGTFYRTQSSGTGTFAANANNQAVWSGDQGRTIGIHPTATQTNNQRVGIAFASTPAVDGLGNTTYNYIIGRSNSTGSVCVFAKFSATQCWLGYTTNGFVTEGIASGPVSHTFNPASVYYLECGDTRGETYYKISAGGTPIIDPGALSFWSGYTNSSYRYGGYAATAVNGTFLFNTWTNPPASMGAFSLADNSSIDYPGIAMRKYKTDSTVISSAGTVGQLSVQPFPSSWYNNQDYLTNPTINGASAGLTFSATDNSVTVNYTGWYLAVVSQSFWNPANTYNSHGIGTAVIQTGSITKNYISAFWQSGTDGTTQKKGAVVGTFMIFAKKGDVLKPGYATTAGAGYQMGSGYLSGTTGITQETWFTVNYVSTAT